jgi:hypothetical protein
MKTIFAVVLLAVVSMSVVSCSKSDDAPDPVIPPIDSTQKTNVDVRGTITTNITWNKNTVYRLRGYVYVTSGAVLKIEPGTKIVSNKDSAGVLVIYKGSKIDAEGTAASPIVFTSAETTPAPGDLGGLIIVGQAKGNTNHKVVEGGLDVAFNAFGGASDEDNSGVLKYVRIEYGGKAVNPGDEVNGLSLYTVGSGTTIEYVQVLRGLDDAFEIFGGTVNLKHIIAYNNADDDFDFDDGYRGMIQFAISIKDPQFTDAKGTGGDISNNFEFDNVNGSNGLPFATTPITSPVMSNFTTIGPNNAANTSADFGYSARFRRGSQFILANSILLGGQKAGLSVESDSTASYYKSGAAGLFNSMLSSVASPFRVAGQTKIPAVLDSAMLAIITTTTNQTTFYPAAADVKLTDPFNNAAPNLKPAGDSPALTAGAKFDLAQLNVAFFEKVTYIGAFDASNDWTAPWAVFNK